MLNALSKARPGTGIDWSIAFVAAQTSVRPLVAIVVTSVDPTGHVLFVVAHAHHTITIAAIDPRIGAS